MATKQVIEIDVTWDHWSKKLNLASLIQFIAAASLTEAAPIKRMSVREIKK